MAYGFQGIRVHHGGRHCSNEQARWKKEPEREVASPSANRKQRANRKRP